MPTYEYRCRNCGEHLEVVQSFTDDALTSCPACGGELRKVFGNVGIVFKGSGFYKTDSRGTSTTAEASPSSDKVSDNPAEKSGDKAAEKPAERSGSGTSPTGGSAAAAERPAGSPSGAATGTPSTAPAAAAGAAAS